MTIYLPSLNDGNHIFVFGSNLRGRHGKGAAREAARVWGAEEGVGFGRTGMAYAVPTKRSPYQTLELRVIGSHIESLLEYARQHPDLTFLVTAIGCGLAGFKPQQIAPFFQDAPPNMVLPEEFTNVIRSFRS